MTIYRLWCLSSWCNKQQLKLQQHNLRENWFKSLDRVGKSGTHNNNELNTLFFPTTTAVAVHLSVSTHVASRSTWQQGPLWLYYVPSSPFHRLSICSFTLSLVFHSFHLYFIYFILFNTVSFCSLSSSSLKQGCGPNLSHRIIAA